LAAKDFCPVNPAENLKMCYFSKCIKAEVGINYFEINREFLIMGFQLNPDS
jgi:hypothetical protein